MLHKEKLNPKVKECAIICVDEILDVLGDVGVYGYADYEVAKFWQEVKEKIKSHFFLKQHK